MASSTPIPSKESVSAAIQDLDSSSVPYISQASPDWPSAIEPFNRRHAPATPSVVAYPTTTAHVQEAVRCAARHGLKVAIKSGGHNYANYGFGGQDGHLVVQLDRMFGVTLRSDNTASVKAGTRLGRVALELFRQGGRGFSHGTCPAVGIGGHIVGGGFGMNSFTHGLSSDWVISADVVLADGSLVRVSETENTDLFWAMCGAGPSFGIVVEYNMRTFAVPSELTWFIVATDLGSKNRREVVDGLAVYQKFVAGGAMPRELNIRLLMTVSGAFFEILYHGGEKEARKLLEPLREPLALVWDSSSNKIGSGGWLESIEAFSNGEKMDITFPYAGRENMYATSLVTNSIPRGALEAFVDYWFTHGRSEDIGGWWLQMGAHGGPNSAVPAGATRTSSYPHRDKLWLFQFCSGPKGSTPFVQRFVDSLKDNMPRDDWGRYMNYIDPELSRKQAQDEYYGKNLERLQKIKAEVDPTELFHYPQSVERAK